MGDLIKCLRQYRHTDSDEFVFAYDRELSDQVVDELNTKINDVVKQLRESNSLIIELMESDIPKHDFWNRCTHSTNQTYTLVEGLKNGNGVDLHSVPDDKQNI